MKQKSTHAAAAAQIRAEMKRLGLTGTVRSYSYSGGNSVHITVTCTGADMLEKFSALETFASQYQYGHFDGMVDLYEYSNRRDDLPQVKFVIVSLEYPDAIWRTQA